MRNPPATPEVEAGDLHTHPGAMPPLPISAATAATAADRPDGPATRVGSALAIWERR